MYVENTYVNELWISLILINCNPDISKGLIKDLIMLIKHLKLFNKGKSIFQKAYVIV